MDEKKRKSETPQDEVKEEANSSVKDVTVDHADSASIEEKHKGLPWWGWTLIAIAAVIVAIAGVFGVQALQVKNHEEKAIAIIKKMPSSLKNSNKLQQQLQNVQNETQSANDITHNILWRAVGKIPGMKSNVANLQGMTVFANEVMHTTVPDYLSVASKLDAKEIMSESGKINVKPIIASIIPLQNANTSLQQSYQQFAQLPVPRHGPVRSTYLKLKKMLDPATLYVDCFTSLIPHLPELLGFEGEQTYAILVETPSEMRFGGGLVGSIGKLTIHNGKYKIGDFESNYDMAKSEKYADVSADEKRLFSDSGPLHLSFDVRDVANAPETHRVAELFKSIWDEYSGTKDTTLNGVITVDPVVVQEVMKVVGEIKLPNGKVINGNNTAEFLLNTAYKDYSPKESDAVFSLIATKCIDALTKDLSLDKVQGVLQDIPAMVEQRHLSIFSFNPDIENILVRAKLNVEAPMNASEPSIGIYITENNPSKLGWYIDRKALIQRTACNENGSQSYHVEYTMTNTMKPEEVGKLPEYITGMMGGAMTGVGMEKVFFYPPMGGNITHFQIEGDATEPDSDTLNWSPVYVSYARLAPGQTVKYSFDVKTSPEARKDLKLDQTPLGWMNPEVTFDKGPCKVEEE